MKRGRLRTMRRAVRPPATVSRGVKLQHSFSRVALRDRYGLGAYIADGLSSKLLPELWHLVTRIEGCISVRDRCDREDAALIT
jgi:hypothetical protein